MVEQKDSFAAFHWQWRACLTRFRLFFPPKIVQNIIFVCFWNEKRLENVAFWHSMVGSFQTRVLYFFLPKKLNLFSRSFSLPSLDRMVTAPASPEPGEMGGMVMARLRARWPPGESPAPEGMEARMEVIQEVISAWTHKSWLQSPSPCIEVGIDLVRPVSAVQLHFFPRNTINHLKTLVLHSRFLNLEWNTISNYTNSINKS